MESRWRSNRTARSSDRDFRISDFDAARASMAARGSSRMRRCIASSSRTAVVTAWVSPSWISSAHRVRSLVIMVSTADWRLSMTVRAPATSCATARIAGCDRPGPRRHPATRASCGGASRLNAAVRWGLTAPSTSPSWRAVASSTGPYTGRERIVSRISRGMRRGHPDRVSLTTSTSPDRSTRWKSSSASRASRSSRRSSMGVLAGSSRMRRVASAQRSTIAISRAVRSAVASSGSAPTARIMARWGSARSSHPGSVVGTEESRTTRLPPSEGSTATLAHPRAASRGPTPGTSFASA